MNNKESQIAVIAITYNGKQHLKECFESLREQTYKDFDTYLLDNASTDGSSDYVKENFPYVNIIRFNKNYGFAEGYNRAIETVDTSFVAILNDDTRVDENWLLELVTAIVKNESIGAVGSKILFYDKPDIINHAGAKISLVGAGFDIGFGEKDSPKFNEEKYVGAVCGGAMLIRKEIFQKVGGFDRDYFAYFEDLDLCWRIWLCGFKVLYVPTSVVYHKFGMSGGGRGSKFRVFHCTKNKISNTLKNFNNWGMVRGIILSLLFDLTRVAIFLCRHQFKSCLAVLKGNFYTAGNLSKMLKKRKEIQKSRKISDVYLYDLHFLSHLIESIREFKRLESGDW